MKKTKTIKFSKTRKNAKIFCVFLLTIKTRLNMAIN